jgi:DNA-binding beta-propeller fold protein YncE
LSLAIVRDLYGRLSSIGSSPYADGQTAPCWVEISHDGRYLFTVNTGSGNISSYAINHDGSLTLIGSTPINGGGADIDARLSPDGRYLLVDGSGMGSKTKAAGDRLSTRTGTASPRRPGSPPAPPAVDLSSYAARSARCNSDPARPDPSRCRNGRGLGRWSDLTMRIRCGRARVRAWSYRKAPLRQKRGRM